MRVRGSVRKLCEYCFVVKRRGKVGGRWPLGAGAKSGADATRPPS
jgi:hypothetical protein